MKRLINGNKILLLILFTCLLLACDQAPLDIIEPIEEGHVLNWNINYMPRRFYPSMALSDEEKQIVCNLYEGLTRVSNNEVFNGMAESITSSEDGLRYEVTLRKTQWSDGRRVTTDDFLYSWERSTNYVQNLNLLYYDAYIDSIEILDENTMIIHMFHQNDQLLKQLSMIAFMPVRRDVIDLDKSIPTFISDVTNGPYFLGAYPLLGGLTLTKNKYYYDFYEVEIDQIQVYLNNDYAKAYNNYKNGSIDFVQGVDHNRLNYLMQNEDDFKLFQKSGIYSFAINSNHDVLKDTRIRRVLNISIDRTEVNPFYELKSDSVMLSMVDYDDVEILNEIDEDSVVGYYMVMKPYAQMDKIDGIISALASGQLNTLNGLKITTRNTPNDITIAKLLVAGWEENLGVKILIDPKDRYDYAYALKTDDYDIILNNQFYIEGNIRYTLKHYFGGAAINTTEFNSETYNARLLGTYQQTDGQLYETFKAATDEIDASTKMIPLFRIYEPIIMSSGIKGWARSYEDLFYFGRASKTVLDKGEPIKK